jgi:hypothetical protein
MERFLSASKSAQIMISEHCTLHLIVPKAKTPPKLQAA